jgi:hypothetical protein
MRRLRPSMQGPPVRVGLGILALGAVTALVAGCTAAPTPGNGNGNADGPVNRSADELSEAFLAEWVDDDGRVVRRDQGDDTVSEGQAYGLLLAAAVGDEERFDAIWQWTQDELVRPDGLLAWQWSEGAVVDDEPASDADLDAARAFVVAGERFDRPELTEQGDALGAVILDELTVETALGRILLPGLWAAQAEPYAYNSSYASPAAFDILGESSGDPRWAELAEGSRAVTTAVLASTDLPPNWSQVRADGTVDAMAGPSAAATVDASSPTGGVEYGYDAARLPIRYAESCDPADTALAAQLLPALDREPTVAAQLDLGGTAVTGDEHPLGYAARAASFAANGDVGAAYGDLETADGVDLETGTYYGAAWSALTAQLLTSESLGGCAPLAGEGTESTSASGASAGGSTVTDPSSAAAGRMQDPELDSASSAVSNAQPVRVRIPSIGVDSGLESLTRDATGWIQPPVDFGSAGWYRDGVVPGQKGPAVIAGHIDSAVGPAVFYDLAGLPDGAEVVVDLSDGSTATFVVDGRIQVPKNDFPTEEVYGPTPDAQLRLVTCGGVFDDSTGHYEDNVVLFATQAGAP